MYIKRKFFTCLAAFLVVMALVVLLNPMGRPGETANASGISPVHLSTKRTDLPADTITHTTFAMLEGESVSQLMERSILIVYGTVTEIYDSIAVAGVNGELKLMTDIAVTPLETFRGDAAEPIILRLEGGYIGNLYDNYEHVPEFHLGAQYLLFLYRPNMGGGCNTEGDYYYLTGSYQGVYRQLPIASEAGAGGADLIKFANAKQLEGTEAAAFSAEYATYFESASQQLSPLETIFTRSALREEMPAFNEAHPIDPDLFRRETLAAYEANVASGVWTQAEYDRQVEDLDNYAAVLTEAAFMELAYAGFAG